MLSGWRSACWQSRNEWTSATGNAIGSVAESVSKTYQEQLRPTPAQERELERVLRRWRTLDTTALAQRISLWRQRGIRLSRYSQEAELKALRAEMPEDAASHSQVLPDVLARLDQTYHAGCRRVQQ